MERVEDVDDVGGDGDRRRRGVRPPRAGEEPRARLPARRGAGAARGGGARCRRCRCCCGRRAATATTSWPSRRSARATASPPCCGATCAQLGYQVHPLEPRRDPRPAPAQHGGAASGWREIAAVAGGPVSLIGHSLGGIYAREVARAAPEHVRRVITVGSPFGGDLKSNVVWPMYESITGTRIKSIPPEVLDRMNEPLPVPSTAIYSRSDGVVAWHSCIDEEAPRGREHRTCRAATSACCTTRRRCTSSPIGWPRRPASTSRSGRRRGCARSPATGRGAGRGKAIAAMSRMRAMDAAFLAMERPAEPRHLGSVSIFGPGRGRAADLRRRAGAARGAARR